MGPDLGVVVDQRHRNVGKALLQPVAVLLADGFRQAEQNEDFAIIEAGTGTAPG